MKLVVRHTFVNSRGKRITRDIDPLQAIFAKCLSCSLSYKEVLLCIVKDCPLWPFRHRKIIEEKFNIKVDGASD